MSFTGIRGLLVAAVAAELPGVTVEQEMPDSLVPPAVVVRYDGTNLGSPGLWVHAYLLECWPSTDLTSSSHYASRDELLTAVMKALQSLQLEGAGLSSWSAGTDERELGQQRYRIATVTALVTEPALCPA